MDTETDSLTPEVDLQINKTNNLDQIRPGDAVSYTITVDNAGPSSIQGATIADSFPDELLDVSFTSAVDIGTASGNTAGGTGNINDLVDMDPGSRIVYTVTGTLADTQLDILSNTATVTAPVGTEERNPNDNTSSHTDPIVHEVDLAISKTDNVTTVVPGQTLTYEIVVQNLGPSGATNVVIQDTFPGALQNVAYTSTATGGAFRPDQRQR